jgi:hypothetical protein
MEPVMLDGPASHCLEVTALGFVDQIDTETLRGHFFRLDLYSLEGDDSLVGGALHFGPDRIALDPAHAVQLADRVRAAIDNCVAGSIIHRPAACREGH